MDRMIYEISQLVHVNEVTDNHIETLQKSFEDLNIDIIESDASGIIRFNYEIGSWHQLLTILRMVMRRLVEKIIYLRQDADFGQFDQMLIKSDLISIRFSNNWISLYGRNIHNIIININSDIAKELVLKSSTNYNKKEAKKHILCKYNESKYSISIGNNSTVGQEATVILRRLIEAFSIIELSTFEVDWLEL